MWAIAAHAPAMTRFAIATFGAPEGGPYRGPTPSSHQGLCSQPKCWQCPHAPRLAAGAFRRLAQRGERRGDDALRIQAGLLVLAGGRGMVDETVGQDHRPYLQAMIEQPRRRQMLQYVAGEAADRALFDGDQHLVLTRQPAHQIG